VNCTEYVESNITLVGVATPPLFQTMTHGAEQDQVSVRSDSEEIVMAESVTTGLK